MGKSEKSLKKICMLFIYDIKSLGIMFVVPIAIYIIIFIYLYFSYFKFNLNIDISVFKKAIGIIPIICVSFWIISLFGEFVDSQIKESLLSLPYNEFKFGVLKVIKISILYIVIYYIFTAICLAYAKLDYTPDFFIMPMIQILFYSSFSFFSVLLARSMSGGYTIVGVFSCISYMTRGGANGYVYPFQWVNPKPGITLYTINIALIVCSMIFLTMSYYIFKNREYLIK